MVFVGIAMGKDLTGPRGAHWPHRFQIEKVERGFKGARPSDIVEVDLAVNEQFEGGLGQRIEDTLGDAPLVGGRYRLGAYTSNAPEGVRYHANGCRGFLTRLSDPEGTEPYRQVLPTGRVGGPPEQPPAGVVDEKERALASPRNIAAGLAVLVVGAAFVVGRIRGRTSSAD